MGFGDRDRERSVGSYGPQTPGLRRDTASREVSVEAALASFETTLEQHTKLIEGMSGQVDNMGKTLAEVKVQISHLVTKEACSEGRKELSEDLKARMDGDRDITGVGITVPKLWQQYVEATRGPITMTPASAQPPMAKSRMATSIPPPLRGVMYYAKAVSTIVSLVFALLTITFFAYKMMDRLDQQQTVMQDIQRNLKRIETEDGQIVSRPGD